MAAAIPVVGAVVGTASAISGISSQKKAANQQKEALAQQQANSETNTALRLIEIERQKIFAEAQNRINQLSQENALQVRRSQDAIEQANLELQAQQLQQNAQLTSGLQQQQNLTALNQIRMQQQNNLAQRQLGLNQINASFGLSEANALTQASLQNAIAGAQSDFQSGQLQNQVALDRANLGIQEQQQLLGVEDQRRQQVQGAEQGLLTSEQQAAQIMDQLANEFSNAERQQRNQLRQQAVQEAQLLAQTGMSGLSNAALSAEGTNQLQQDLIQRAAQASGTIDSINQDAALQQALRDYLVTDANARAQLQSQNVQGQTQLGRLSLLQGLLTGQTGNQLQRDIANRQTQVQRDLSLQNASVQRALALQGIDVTSMSQQQQLELQRRLQTNQNAQQQILNTISQEEQFYENLINQGAFNVSQLAGETAGKLQTEMGQLNEMFSDIALSSGATNAQIAGQAELDAIKAQKNSIQSPSFLNTLGTVAQGAASIYGALPSSNNQSAPPQNPFFSPQQTQANFSFLKLPEISNNTGTNPNSFTSSFLGG